MIKYRTIDKADCLPIDWNLLADNYFQQTPFLVHTEAYNPCHQRYYLCYDDDHLIAAAIVYTLRIDLLAYLKIKSPLKMHVVGIPCSVSCQGIFGNITAVELLKSHIYTVEKGFILFLNLREKPMVSPGAIGTTLPTIVLENHYETWDIYLASLRSGYRHRLKKINLNNPDLLIEKKQCTEFTDEMYKLYLQVYLRSKGKLEKLTPEFFKKLPPEFNLSVCSKNNQLIGWNIALYHNTTWYFFLGGIDYSANKINQTYFRLLTNLVKDGISMNPEIIELGQTAEIPKMRLGGKAIPLYMEAYHSNFILNQLLRLSGRWLEYKSKPEDGHPFKRTDK